MGNASNKPSQKISTCCWGCYGKYHPHGDSAIYDTMVRLVQDFSMRAPLIDGQGNFGSVDGDGAAAMRYTEVRLTKLAETFLEDIEKIQFLWSKLWWYTFWTLHCFQTSCSKSLLNGASGIAVGMATNIPPHNLNELCLALVHLIENPECKNKDIYKIVKGPDFPTAGEIYGHKGIEEAYETGRVNLPFVQRHRLNLGKTENIKLL